MFLKCSFRLLSIVLLLGLAACSGGVDRRNYENAAGEALVKEVLKSVPEFPDGLDRVYTIVLGAEMVPASSEFMHRFKPLKLKFISGYQLDVDQQKEIPVDPGTGLSPITIQYSEVSVKDKKVGDEIPVTAAWAYREAYQKRGYVLLLKEEGKWEVHSGAVIDENLEMLKTSQESEAPAANVEGPEAP